MSKRRIVIIDGYNAIHKVPSLKRALNRSLQQGRDALIRLCLSWKQTRGDVSEFIVVFDGNSSVLNDGASAPLGVRQIFSRTGETADDRIVAMAKDVPPDCEYVVVSDDNEIRLRSWAAEVERMSVSEFFQTLQRTKSCKRGQATDEPSDDKKLSPKARKEINDSLREAFGID